MQPNLRTSKRPVEDVDPNWRGLYRAGGICMLVTGIIYVIGAVISITLGPPPSGGEAYLNALAGHAMLAQGNIALFALADFLLIPVVMALYLALKGINRNAMLVAAGFMSLFIVLDLGITEANSLTLVTLTQNYAAATSDATRAAYVAAANYALATLPIGAFYSYVMSSVGFLITGLVMLKGLFSRPTGCLGIVASIEGIVGGFYILVPALATLLIPSLITFAIWSLFAGSRLYKLGNR